MNLDDPKLEMKLKVWDAIIKSFTALLLVTSALVAVFSYLAQNRREERERVKELGLTVYRSRIDIYAEASDAAAKFAEASNLEDAEKAEQRFLEIYDGKLSILEDQLVLDTMVMYGELLDAWDDCDEQPEDGPPAIFREATYNLSQACRLNLSEAFPTEVKTLQYDPNDPAGPALTVDQVKAKNEELRSRVKEVCEKEE